jgi:hypothetical protein
LKIYNIPGYAPIVLLEGVEISDRVVAVEFEEWPGYTVVALKLQIPYSIEDLMPGGMTMDVKRLLPKESAHVDPVLDS